MRKSQALNGLSAAHHIPEELTMGLHDKGNIAKVREITECPPSTSIHGSLVRLGKIGKLPVVPGEIT